jgi:putative peptidoglycan lipid II flippase
VYRIFRNTAAAVGIPDRFSIHSCRHTYASMLYRGLRKQHVLHHSPGWQRTLWQVLAGNVAMGLFLWFVAGDTGRWIQMDAWHRVGWMTLLVVGGGGIYFGVLYVLGLRVQHLRVQRLVVPPRPAEPAP